MREIDDFAIITTKPPSDEVLESHFPRMTERAGQKPLKREDFYACKPDEEGRYFVLLIGGIQLGNPHEIVCVFPGSRVPDILEVIELARRNEMECLSFLTYRSTRFAGPIPKETESPQSNP